MNLKLNRNRFVEGCGTYCAFGITLLILLFIFFQWIVPCLRRRFAPPPPPIQQGTNGAAFTPAGQDYSIAVNHVEEMHMNGTYAVEEFERVGISYVITTSGPEIKAIWMVPDSTNGNLWDGISALVDTSTIESGESNTVSSGSALAYDEFGNLIINLPQTCNVCVERKGFWSADETSGFDWQADDGSEPAMIDWEPVISGPVPMNVTNVLIDGFAYPNKAFYRVRIIP